MKFSLSLIMLVFAITFVMAQESGVTNDLSKLKQQSTAAPNPKVENTILSQNAEWIKLVPYLCIGLMVFACLFFAVITIKIKEPTIDILKIHTIPLIIFLSVFLVIIGYSQTQLTPVLGLLGTVVGYLLGKQNTNP